MKKIGILLSIALVINCYLLGQSVTRNEAETIAKLFMSIEDGKRHKNSIIVENEYTYLNETGEALYHVFNFENGGFVLVAGDKRVQPILAYSLTNTFALDNANPAVDFWINQQYAKPIDAMKKDASIVAKAEVSQQWNEIVTGKKQKVYADKVEPLLTSQWNQNRYYNTSCPDDKNSKPHSDPQHNFDYHVPNGCVALAMAQIMYYHRYPRQGEGSHDYSTKYGKLSADFENTEYNYEAMSDVAEGYSDAIARLIFHAGVSVEMDYDADASGVTLSEQKAREALTGYFRYKNTARAFSRSNFSDQKWMDTIKSNLNVGLPVYYAAFSNSGGRDAGHAFVCDGYDENDLFHFNWGWGGNSNGYYSLNLMDPPNYQYVHSNRIVLNLVPINDTVNFFTGTKKLTATYGSFNDGSGYLDYRENTNSSWLISPQDGRSINSITLKVSTFSLGDGDRVYIYSGNSQSGTLVATLGGKITSGEAYTITDSEAFVVFESDNDGVVGDGFTFTYSTSRQSSSYCVTYPTSPSKHTSDSGRFSNGTPSGVDYISSNTCYWAVTPANGNGQVKLAFSRFDLEYGDIIEFLKWPAQSVNADSWQYTENGLYRFTKETPPELNKYYTINMSTALVYFRTDNDLTASGFEIYWDVNDTVVSLNEYVGNITNLSVYPNPSTDYLMVDLTTSSDETIQLSLYDLLGKEVYSTTPVEITGNYTEKINVNNFSKGMYLLRVATTNGVTTKKVIIK